LYVIYNEDLPIDVSLNFHYNNLMFSYLSSYDLDYAKFSLGNIGIYKQVEWCIDNKIVLYDIGYGDYEYKRRWVNFVYDFETYYISNKNSLFLRFFSSLHHAKAKLIHYLILKRVNYWFHDTVDRIKSIDKKYVPLEYDEFDSEELQYDNRIIDINTEDSFFLRKPVYDHAYSHQEHINDLMVYKSLDTSNSYVIKGKKSESGFKFKS
jgi:hypothetical protein